MNDLELDVETMNDLIYSYCYKHQEIFFLNMSDAWETKTCIFPGITHIWAATWENQQCEFDRVWHKPGCAATGDG